MYSEIKSKIEKNGFYKYIILFFSYLKYKIPFLSGLYYKMRTKEIELIRNSNLFDVDYYLNNNQDVKKEEIDPVIHYLIYGGKEGRKASINFDSKFYLDKYTDVKKSNINPLLHYLKFGFKEDRIINESGQSKCFLNKEKIIKKKYSELVSFLESNETIELTFPNPVISIIIVLYNKAELSFSCFKSIEQNADLPVEIIIVDNNSNDLTAKLLDKLNVSKIIRNNDNLHFLKACNQGLEFVSTSYVLLLNNDTEISKGTLSRALKTINENQKNGAVGAKLIRHDGSLQEAGNIIWYDGSCLGYGRGDNPNLPKYNFKRIVDYCSAAFLLTRTSLFKRHSGFDTRFSPAYYEETDYCLWLQKEGFYVVYDPNLVVKHFEFGSTSFDISTKLMENNRKVFVDKHNITLKNHFENNNINIEKARFAATLKIKKRILYIDDRIPHSSLGRGFPRSNSIVNLLHEIGCHLTIYPNTFSVEETFEEVYSDINPYIEVATGFGINGFKGFLESRKDYYDIFWISRPHNMHFLKDYLFTTNRKYNVVYDAEAIFAERELQKALLFGNNNTDKIRQKIIDEYKLALDADMIITVSETDAEKFQNYGIKNIKVLGHFLEPESDIKGFASRKDLLFVGNLDNDESPNVDSLIWFIKNVFPLIQKKIPDIILHIVGSNNAESLQKLKSVNICFHGFVDDTKNFYNSCRVFVSPTRFAAGIPYKIHESAAYGLPVVATSLLAKQLSWEHEKHLLVSESEPEEFSNAIIHLYYDEQLWNKISINAISEIRQSHNKNSFSNVLKEVLDFDKINSKKVEEYWSGINLDEQFSKDIYWMANSNVQKYIQFAATAGKKNTHWVNYVFDKYFSNNGNNDLMLSIGCGNGELERHLSQLKAFKEILALDISEKRIETAKQLAKYNNCKNIIYNVRDVEMNGIPDKKYNAVFFNSSLHHFKGIDKLLFEITKLLMPNGYLVLNEYVGPNRLRYTEKEKQILSETFKKIPEKYRVSLNKNNFGEVIREPLFFDPIEVARVDPSEAINSEAIIPSVQKYFNIVEFNKIGGSLLHVLLTNIAGHFNENDSESIKVLDSLITTEQKLINSRKLSNHFALIVAKTKEKI
jgi:GT2 family glycosyltransferase/ubiquinone/menaquinone biosynthesis C-methylase UbiE